LGAGDSIKNTAVAFLPEVIAKITNSHSDAWIHKSLASVGQQHIDVDL